MQRVERDPLPFSERKRLFERTHAQLRPLQVDEQVRLHSGAPCRLPQRLDLHRGFFQRAVAEVEAQTRHPQAQHALQYVGPRACGAERSVNLHGILQIQFDRYSVKKSFPEKKKRSSVVCGSLSDQEVLTVPSGEICGARIE